ncbi:Do family serine endopeptidase [Asaia sp. HN010]|uniref:Do family serine endopeptidase n=1 Tax=Asaia sp. HN010 TaxID=3081233 RepID=UPI0030191DD5
MKHRLVLAALMGGWVSASSSVLAQPAAPPVTPAANAAAAPGNGAATARSVHAAPDSLADLAARLLPAVVNISISATLKPGEDEDDDDGPDASPDDGPQVPQFPPGSPMEKFFHDYMNHAPNPSDPPRKMQALGSGFIISPDGYIVTNNHVIKDADKVSVTLQDGTVLPAKIVGRDSRTDLGVIKIEGKTPFPTVSFGDSDKARVGDRVLAIGNPFGLSGTVTSGIVSSRGRDINHGLYDDYIQTDASINRGNSGGPLFDLDGQVIGINTAIYSSSGGSIGIGFAIPANDAKGVIEQLRRDGHVSRGWVGVRVQDVTHEIADSIGLKPEKGAMIAGVDPKGPAAAAKLQTGDVITSLDGKPIDGHALPRLVAEITPGTKAVFGIWRKGKTLDATLIIKPSPEAPDMPPTEAKTKGPSKLALADLGVTFSAIDDDTRAKYNLSDSQRGVVVTDVTRDGPADTRGLQPGDVVTEVQQVGVNSPDALSKELTRARQQKKHTILLLVQGQDGLRWVPLPLSGE